MNKQQLFDLLSQISPKSLQGRSIDDFTEEALRGLLADAQARHEMPIQVRLAPIGSVNVEARTADVVWSTGARVKRYDWSRGNYYMEELSLDPAHVRMGRLQNGAPLLNAHNRWTLEDQIGVVDSATLANGEGRATVRFSSRDTVEPIFRDVKDKIIRNVSVGYATYRMEQLPPDARSEGLPIYRAIDWEPQEISPVPIGADADAGFRSAQTRTFSCEFISRGMPEVVPTRGAAPTTARKEPLMNKEQMYELVKRLAPKKLGGKTLDEVTEADLVRMMGELSVREIAADASAPAGGQGTQEPPANAAQITAAERARIAAIDELVRTHGLDQAFRARMVDGSIAIESVRSQVLDELTARSGRSNVSSGVELTEDETVIRRTAIATALLHRSQPSIYKLDDAARKYRGFSLLELARSSLEMRGVKTAGMTRMEIATRMFESTSDLPAIFLDAANKSLRRAYDSTPRSYQRWARQSSAPDFKNINRLQLSGAPNLLQVLPGEEYKYGAVTDGKEVYQLATFGRIIPFTRQSIINDDTQALSRLPELMARAAADLESDTVYAIFTTNPNMADGVPLFHANHGNLTGSGTAIGVDSLGVARKSMRVQTGLEGRPINVDMKYLIVPAAKETVAQQYTSADFVSAKSSDINPFKGTLEPVPEPRLDVASTTAWFGAADPSQIDTVEYAYLEGQEGVYLETRMGFNVDGMEMKARLDFAAKALDWRGLYKNVGA